MPKSQNRKSIINVKGTDITVISHEDQDFISLSDMVKGFDGGSALIEQWLRNKDTIEFLAVWEQIYNIDFNSLEFEGIRNESGTNRFFMSVKKWVSKTNAKGLKATAGRYGGTFAHKDIAFEFGTWLSPEFKLYLIKEFQRLKDDENKRLSLDWNLQRTLAKVNYRIHTNAIKEKLIPGKLIEKQINFIYANEADVLNMALFCNTAKQWRDANPDKKGNIRDHAEISQLICLSNLENMNAHFINEGINQPERLIKLNQIAIQQMKLLIGDKRIDQLLEKK